MAAGKQVTVLLIRNSSPHLQNLHPDVEQIKLRSSSSWTALPEIVGYLKNNKPDIFIAVKDRGIKVAAAAKFISGYQGLVLGQLHNNMIVGLANRSRISRTLRHTAMRTLYPQLDHIITVSKDAAAAVCSITKLSPDDVTVLPNAVITPLIKQQSESSARHPWLNSNDVPVVVGIGRLSPQKNFALLLRAFAQVLEQLDARLIIFGEGKLKNTLLRRANSLGIADKVDLPGFINNPFAELKHASVFVLSSDWEGSPTVLAEALSLGVPCVATDVGDTKVTLQDGDIGKICGRQDPHALAEAILTTLKKPPMTENLKMAVEKFSTSNSTESYLAHFDKLRARHVKQ